MSSPALSSPAGASIAELSRQMGDPQGVAEWRRATFDRVRELPLEPDPLYRQYGYFAGVELDRLDPSASGAEPRVPPPKPGEALIVHAAHGSSIRLGSDLAREGFVRAIPLTEIWSSGSDAARSFAAPPGEFTDKLSALAAALLNRGYRLELSGRPQGPIRVRDLTVLTSPREALSVRRNIAIGPDIELLLTEEVYSSAPADDAQRLISSATELELGPGARATVLSLHAPDDRTVGVYHRGASLGPGCRMAWIFAGLGGFRTKVRNRTDLNGNGSAADDLQTFFGLGKQSYDSGMAMTHRGTDTHGQSITRGLFRDEARGMSRGLVRIEKEARRTLSFLSEHAMLLSRGARSDTIPILEILCRDVKATHSSSVAPVDPEKVFYLESRGMEREAAVRMIGEGFLSYVLDRAPIPGLREVLYPYLAARWDGRPIVWGDPERLLLPDLSRTGGEAAVDWRFDTKLR